MLKYDKKSMVIVPIEPDNNMVGTGQWSNQADSSPLGSEAAIKCYKRMLSERPYIQPVIALSDVHVLVDALKWYSSEKYWACDVLLHETGEKPFKVAQEALKTFTDIVGE